MKKKKENKKWEELAKALSNELADDNFSLHQDFKTDVETSKKDLEIVDDINDMQRFNANKAWSKLHERFVNEGLVEEKPVRRLRQNSNILFRIAALLILALVISLFANNLLKNNSTHEMLSAGYGQKDKSLVLADGSEVHINSSSQISYPSIFEEKYRRVKLNGEAFFDVARDENKPFIIEAGNFEVKVLGTSFNVRQVGDEVEVFVETGKVQLYNPNKLTESVIIEPGYVGKISANNVAKVKNTNDNITSWRTKTLKFKETQLNQVISDLENTYDKSIVFDSENINNYKLTSVYNNQDFEVVIQSICISFNLTYEINGNTVYLKEKV